MMKYYWEIMDYGGVRYVEAKTLNWIIARMRRLRFRLAYWLRLLAYKIEPVIDWGDLGDYIHSINPQETPFSDHIKKDP